ncbi:MAG: DUF262 domain-containing protein [Saprospiraceae bacterium]|nr:DUF262 domain-containing protein [Saprospiraceae bacterium]
MNFFDFGKNDFQNSDYQRGFAWSEKQLKDFWNDLIQLEKKRTTMQELTLENVSKEIYDKWEDDIWIISSKNIKPYYIVDGQQRLTTIIILIQCITKVGKKKWVGDNKVKLNYTSIEDIQKNYIFDSKDDGISRSYIFGYEKDNPSYEFLKVNIFEESSSSGYNIEETIYTHNLTNAKIFY